MLWLTVIHMSICCGWQQYTCQYWYPSLCCDFVLPAGIKTWRYSSLPLALTLLTKITTSGALRHNSASATLAFCPPERSFIFIVCAWLTKPNVPSCFRAFSYGRLNNLIRYSAGVSSAVRCSPECWSNLPIRWSKCKGHFKLKV